MTLGKSCSALAALLAAALAGCNGPGALTASPPPAVGQVDRVVLSPVPVASNWDGRPGPDGLEVTVRLFQYRRELPVTVKGTLEFLLYEGVIDAQELPETQPVRTWRFSEDGLREHLHRSMFGWGYSVRLGWASDVPQTSSVTLLTRYLPPEGPPVVSRPMAVLMRPR